MSNDEILFNDDDCLLIETDEESNVFLIFENFAKNEVDMSLIVPTGHKRPKKPSDIKDFDLIYHVELEEEEIQNLIEILQKNKDYPENDGLHDKNGNLILSF